MLHTIEFSTILSDNQHIDIPTNFRSQLKANQAVRVSVVIDETKPMERKKERKLGTLAGKLSIPDDFDEPLEDFKDYM